MHEVVTGDHQNSAQCLNFDYVLDVTTASMHRCTCPEGT